MYTLEEHTDYFCFLSILYLSKYLEKVQSHTNLISFQEGINAMLFTFSD